jgi:hypothetical protein
VVIGLRKPYIKAVVGTGLELIFIDKTFSVVVVRGHSNTLFPLDDEEVRLLLMAIMRLELQWSPKSLRQQVNTSKLFTYISVKRVLSSYQPGEKVGAGNRRSTIQGRLDFRS